MTEFFKENNITRDNTLARALNYNCININTYLELKDMLKIDYDMFLEILFELERSEK